MEEEEIVHARDDPYRRLGTAVLAQQGLYRWSLQPNARMPVPHYHESWDETVYGLTGTARHLFRGKIYDLTMLR
jgi:hypothetical protein